MDLEKLKKEIENSQSLRQFEKAVVYNNSFVYVGGEQLEDFPLSIVEKDNFIVISDLAITYDRLIQKEIDLNDEEWVSYVNKVLKSFDVKIGNKNELFILASSEKDCPVAISKLMQAVILLSYLELQYEE